MNKNFTLYELTNNYFEVLELIEQGEENLYETLESINEAIEVKAENYGKLIKHLENTVIAIKTETERLEKKTKVYNNNIKALKNSLEQMMINIDLNKINTPLFNFRIQNNPPSVAIDNNAKLPDKYYIPQDPKINKKELLKDLKNGEVIEGAKIKVTKGLRIR